MYQFTPHTGASAAHGPVTNVSSPTCSVLLAPPNTDGAGDVDEHKENAGAAVLETANWPCKYTVGARMTNSGLQFTLQCTYSCARYTAIHARDGFQSMH